MTTTQEATGSAAAQATAEILVSSDSHIIEPVDLWTSRLPAKFKDNAPYYPEERDASMDKPGGHDPNERLKEMVTDGVSAEVLYPTLGLKTFALEDPALQEATFQVYNDWIAEYCQVSLDRLVGVPMISMYNIDNAVKELERCAKLGLKGALIWQSPHPDLPFTSEHYDPFWAAAQDLEMPVSIHILTGFNYSINLLHRTGLDVYRTSVNEKLNEAMNTLFYIVFSGVLERFPKLKIVLVENEIGWIPFVVSQWDKYYQRPNQRKKMPLTLSMLPSEYMDRQVFATFFNDPPGGYMLGYWGEDNCMWSNDYPHPNSTWPHSREVIARDLSHLSPEARAKIVRETVVKLYGLKIPALS